MCGHSLKRGGTGLRSNEMDEEFAVVIVGMWDQAEAVLKQLVQPPADAAESGSKPPPTFTPSPSCLLSEHLVNRLLTQLLDSPQVCPCPDALPECITGGSLHLKWISILVRTATYAGYMALFS